MSPKERAKEIYFTCLNVGNGYISEYLAGQFANYVIQELQNNAENEYYLKVEKELKKLLNSK